MNRIIISLAILLITSCQIFKKKTGSTNHFHNLTIHANTDIAQSPIKGLRVKTKINILSDSIIVSASPVLGIEVFRLSITKDTIYIDNKLQNTKDALAVSEMDPKFKLKNIKKLIINTRNRKDTMRYKNNYITTLFTDYINKQNLFLPQKIIFWRNDTDQKAPMRQEINIDYKAIKNYYKK
tara:strand:- start:877 stop:1419 length:543 start_codon:yes stop_codon:yes gene_type:complete